MNLNIIATQVNHAPDAKDDNLNGTANQAIVIAPATLLANDSDIDGDSIQGVSIQDAVNGTVTFDGTNVIFTPTAGYSGPASFTYTIKDSNGATDTATVNLIIGSLVNHAPDAIDKEFTIFTNQPATFAPRTLISLATDVDGDIVQGASIQDAVNGTVNFDGKNVIFTPNEGYSGPASFTYTVTDGKGGYDTATVNLTVIVNPNLAPTAVDDLFYVKTDTTEIIQKSTQLSNDSDPTGDTLKVVSIQEAVHGAFIEFNNGATDPSDIPVAFKPDAGYTGPASFKYTMTDGFGNYDTATVNLMVGDYLDAQGNRIFALSDNGPIPVNLTNSVLAAFDEKIALLSSIDEKYWVSISNVVGGTIQNLGFGEESVFVPTPGFTGQAYFDYTIHAPSNFDIVGNIDIGRATLSFGPQLPPAQQPSLIIPADTLIGSADNDDIGNNPYGPRILVGGGGNDTLESNDIFGEKTFVWSLADTKGNGIEYDVISFYTAINVNGKFLHNDKLDLRDLLIGESNNANSLDNYLHFNNVTENVNNQTVVSTEISISAYGTFANNNPSGANVTGTVDQIIKLEGVDLTAGQTKSDVQIIQTLLYNKYLITD